MNVPRVTVGVVVQHQGRILLLKSHKWHGKHILPCGHVEFGERLADAAKREVREETGLHATNIRLLRVDEMIQSSEFHDSNRHFVTINFTCETDTTDVLLNEEAESYVWVTPEEGLRLETDSLTAASLHALLRKAL